MVPIVSVTLCLPPPAGCSPTRARPSRRQANSCSVFSMHQVRVAMLWLGTVSVSAERRCVLANAPSFHTHTPPLSPTHTYAGASPLPTRLSRSILLLGILGQYGLSKLAAFVRRQRWSELPEVRRVQENLKAHTRAPTQTQTHIRTQHTVHITHPHNTHSTHVPTHCSRRRILRQWRTCLHVGPFVPHPRGMSLSCVGTLAGAG